MQDNTNEFGISHWKLASSIGKMKTKSAWHKFNLDPYLFALIILIFCISFIVVYSASPDIAVLKRHGIRVGLSIFIMIGVAQISPRTLQSFSFWFYSLHWIIR